MKKTLFIAGLFILALATSLTSCNLRGGNDDPALTENSITLGKDVYPITSALLIVDKFENEVDVKFNCDELEFTIDLNGLSTLPVGTLELNRNGKYTAEAETRYSDKDYDVTGNLTVSETSDIFDITVIGKAYRDRGPKDFTLSYKGNLTKLNDR